MKELQKCKGTGCPLKDHCHRYTMRDNDFYQIYFFDIPFKDGECIYFIDVEHKNELL